MCGAVEVSDGVVRAAAEGSRSDLRRVLEAVEQQVHNTVAARLSATPNHFHVVAEISQLVMLAISEGIGRLRNRTVAGFKAYVSGIVAHKVADHLNRRGEGDGVGPPMRSLDSTVTHLSEAGPLWQFLSGSFTSPGSVVARAELAQRVMCELGRLKPEHREVIILALFDQLPISDVAKRMAISRPAASMLLIRAVRTLRRQMTGSSQLVQGYGSSA
jgi:RNA polymerase sigma factor (sigma-70 family)